MTSAVKKILEDALALPRDEFDELMEALNEARTPVEVEPELRDKLESRIREIERGEVELVPWEDAERRLRARLEAIRRERSA